MEDGVQVFTNVREELLIAKERCRERQEIGKLSRERYKELSKQIIELQDARVVTVSAINHIIGLVKLSEVYLELKQQESQKAIQHAIDSAGQVVSGAGMEGARLRIEDKKAWISTDLTDDVREQEGSGLRSVLSILLRYTFLTTKSSSFKMIIIDEGLGPLSDETVQCFRDYLEIFKKDCLVIGIEQRSYTYDGLADKVFEFSKVDGTTRVRQIS